MTVTLSNVKASRTGGFYNKSPKDYLRFAALRFFAGAFLATFLTVFFAAFLAGFFLGAAFLAAFLFGAAFLAGLRTAFFTDFFFAAIGQ